MVIRWKCAVRGKASVLFSWQVSFKLGGMEAPQPLSNQAVEEFKAIYRDEFGDHISDGDALEMALRLLRLFDLLLHP